MPKKILIVDDEVETVKLIGLMLQRHGYEITAAQTGGQALEKAVSENPDLIILDVMMPDMDGYEVCRRLRSNPATVDLPIIMFTAKTQIDEKVAGFQAGADDYLTKPIHPDELVSRVEAALSRSTRRKKDEKPEIAAKVLAFLGAKGGVGTTTLAANVAVALTQGPIEEKRIVVAELRTGLANLHLLMGSRHHGALGQLVSHPAGRIDVRVVEAQLEEHTTGVLFLGGQVEPPGRAAPVSPNHADVIIRSLATIADVVLLDLGVGLEETNRRVLVGCTSVVLVIEPHRGSISLARVLIDDLVRSVNVARHRIHPVLVNKAPAGTTHTKVAVEDMLQHDLTAVIPPAPDLAFQAVERGVPMVMAQPDSLVAQQIRALAEHLANV